MRNIELWIALYLLLGLGLAAALRGQPAAHSPLAPVLITLFWPIFVPLASLSPAMPRPREAEARALLQALRAASSEAPPALAGSLRRLGPELLALAQRADAEAARPQAEEPGASRALHAARAALRQSGAPEGPGAERRWAGARDACAELCARLERPGPPTADADPSTELNALLSAIRAPDHLEHPEPEGRSEA